jgi:hypothetical protein
MNPKVPEYPFPILHWDSTNYSCAYDSLLTPLFAYWSNMDPFQQRVFASSNELTAVIAEEFASVELTDRQFRSRKLHGARERLRNILSIKNPTEFPRFGPNLISLDNLFQEIGFDRALSFRRQFGCQSCRAVSTHGSIEDVELAYVFSTDAIRGVGTPTPSVVSVQEWLATQLRPDPDHRCRNCLQPLTLHSAYSLDTQFPPLLVFHSNPSPIVGLQPSPMLSLPGQHEGQQQCYRLCGITFYCNAHFTAWIIQGSQCWSYDGMNTSPTLLNITVPDLLQQPNVLEAYCNHIPVHFIYSMEAGDHQP